MVLTYDWHVGNIVVVPVSGYGIRGRNPEEVTLLTGQIDESQ